MFKTNLLKDAGLNENESKVYQRLLEYGELAPPKIAQLTGLTRQNTYAILKSLTEKGLAEEYDKQKKLTYRLLHPQKLLDYVENQKIQTQMVEDSVRAAIPSLTNLFNMTNKKSSISYFKGFEGVKLIWEDTIRTKPKEIMVFQSSYDTEKLGSHLRGFLKRRAATGITNRIITPKVGAMGEIVDEPELRRQVKYIPENLFQAGVEIAFSDSLVTFVSLKKQITSFVIADKEVANTLKIIFELVWITDYSKACKQFKSVI